ncbi:MAG: rod shape-determining protein MreD [Spirochaetales bacterium]|nr:rod shape-determining protein MreD [Spirochaetales bacterium]
MNNKTKITILSIFIVFIALLLQSTLLNYLAIESVKPDLALIALIFISIRRGNVPGQISGFASGLFQDFISLPPPVGFYAIIRTIVGFVFGFFEGRLFVDPVIVPVILVIIGTLLKGVLATVAGIGFGILNTGFELISFKFLIEVIYNAVCAPLIFSLLNRFKSFKISEKEKLL